MIITQHAKTANAPFDSFGSLVAFVGFQLKNTNILDGPVVLWA